MISLSPLVTVALSLVLLRERTGKLGTLGIVLALCSLPLFDYAGGASGPRGRRLWPLWFLPALGVLVAWGVQAFFMKLANATMDAESIFFYMMVTGLLLAPVALAMTDFSVPINWGADGPYLAAATQILNSVGALCLVYAFRYGKAIVVSPLTNAGAPLITAVLSIMLARHGTHRDQNCRRRPGAPGRRVPGHRARTHGDRCGRNTRGRAQHGAAALDHKGEWSVMIIRRDTSNRRERIVALLREQGSVQIPALAERFRVSTQTLRKDLNFLDNKGICTRSSGGAILGARAIAHRAGDRGQTHAFAEEKARIGRAAAGLIKDDESVLLDSGTTALQVARHIEAAASLVVVTNDAGIMNELLARENVQLVFLGGTLRRKNLSFYGTQTERALQDLHVEKLFFAADGFDIEKGVTTHFEPEALLNRMMCRAASEIIVVADSSKFGRICLHRILEPQGISKLVTDTGIPDSAREALTVIGVEVIIA